MTNKEAKYFLTHYICSCPYGTSPANCEDAECKFGIAVRTLCVEERPQGKWVYGNLDHSTCSNCNYINHYGDLPFCPNCGAEMANNGE